MTCKESLAYNRKVQSGTVGNLLVQARSVSNMQIQSSRGYQSTPWAVPSAIAFSNGVVTCEFGMPHNFGFLAKFKILL